MRGGGSYRNWNVNLAEKHMTIFYKGKEDDVWKTAMEIEESRRKKRASQKNKQRKRNLKGARINKRAQNDEVKRRSDRAKMLTNDRELSKAFARMVQRGVASSTDNIITLLKAKFPLRKNQMMWPHKDRIAQLRDMIQKTLSEMEVDEREDENELFVSSDLGLVSDSLLELPKSIENYFQAVQVRREDIVRVASTAKKSTGAGLC